VTPSSEAPVYTALALQSLCETVNSYAAPQDARAAMLRSIQRIRAEIAGSIAFIGLILLFSCFILQVAICHFVRCVVRQALARPPFVQCLLLFFT
jgi:hypothetical protein